MTLEELTAQLEQELAKADVLLGGGGMPAEELPAEELPPTETASPDAMLSDLTPSLIQEATSVLVQGNLLDTATAQMTPELVQKLQSIADAIDPGLFDLRETQQLTEFLNGIIDGTIASAVAAGGPGTAPAPGAEPELAGDPAGAIAPAGVPAGAAIPPG